MLDGRLLIDAHVHTDWPGVPGIARNARALAALDLGGDTLGEVLAGNAMRIYRGLAGRD